MSSDDLALVILIAGVIPANLFPIIFGFTSPWYRSLIGRALLTSTISVGMLIDISLAYRVLGANYAGRDIIRTLVFGLMTVGLWLEFIALLRAKLHRQHLLRDDGQLPL